VCTTLLYYDNNTKVTAEVFFKQTCQVNRISYNSDFLLYPRAQILLCA